MVRRSRAEIQAEVYLRLSFFDYERFPSIKPAKIQEIENWLEAEPNKVHSKKLTWRDGWLTKYHVESSPCPYGSPEAHRGEYLRRDPYNFIERKKYSYVVQKPGQKNRSEYTEEVYRLRRDQNSRKKVIQLLAKYSPYFSLSDYLRITFNEKNARLNQARWNIYQALTLKDKTGLYGNCDKAYLEALLEDLELVIKDVQNEKERAHFIPKHERDVMRKKVSAEIAALAPIQKMQLWDNMNFTKLM